MRNMEFRGEPSEGDPRFMGLMRQAVALGTEAHLRAHESTAWESLGVACTASAVAMIHEGWITEAELDALCDPADVTAATRLATDGDDFEALAVRAFELATLAEMIGDDDGPANAYSLGGELFSRVHAVTTEHLGEAATSALVSSATTLAMARVEMERGWNLPGSPLDP